MSTARHRDDRPWWEKDNRTWGEAGEWLAFWVGAPIVTVLVFIVGLVAMKP